MKKSICLVMILALVLAFAACGSKAAEMEVGAVRDVYKYSNDMDYGTAIMTSESFENEKIQAYSKQDSNYNPIADAKLIYTADVDIQTTDWDKDYSAIKDLVEKYKGYFETSEVYNGGYNADYTYKRGEYTVRIPSESYRTFLEGVSGISHVVSMSEDVDDVGEKYFDLEARLKTLREKEARLQELLAKANSVSELIEIENALANTEYEIEMYQSNLNHYDALINYSTVRISIEQVNRVDGSIGQKTNFFDRIWKSLTKGASNFVDAMDDFANWIVYNIITLVIIAAVIVVICKFHLLRKFFGLFRRKNKE